MTTETRPQRWTQDERFDMLFTSLAADGQDPRDAGRYGSARVISAAHRGRPGRFDVYVTTHGGWSHSRRGLLKCD